MRNAKAGPTPEARKIGERIRSARIAAGLTQQQVTDAMDVTKSLMGQYESGQTLPSILSLKTLCATCKVSADYLLWGTAPSPQFSDQVQRVAAWLDSLPPETLTGVLSVFEPAIKEWEENSQNAALGGRKTRSDAGSLKPIP